MSRRSALKAPRYFKLVLPLPHYLPSHKAKNVFNFNQSISYTDILYNDDDDNDDDDKWHNSCLFYTYTDVSATTCLHYRKYSVFELSPKLGLSDHIFTLKGNW